MNKPFAMVGALSAFVSIAAGAFAAHVLRQRITQEMLAVFQTAAQYQMYHALALLAVAYAGGQRPDGLLRVSGICFAAGTLLFSGSLYVLALSGLRWLGAVTPLGGTAFLAGWLAFAWWIGRRSGSTQHK